MGFHFGCALYRAIPRLDLVAKARSRSVDVALLLWSRAVPEAPRRSRQKRALYVMGQGLGSCKPMPTLF